MTDIFLGVDGGQSSTTAMIGDAQGRVLGLGQDGPCNHVSGPAARDKFINAIGGAVRRALAAAGLSETHRDFAAACFGFSGGPKDKQPLIEEMFLIASLVVTHDGLIALAGATVGQPGIIAIAGTGQLAFGRNAAGRTARAGGWGYVYGDEGGGFDLVRQALRAALRMEEGWGPETALRRVLLEATGAANANDLLHQFYTVEWPRPRIAALSKLVDEAAVAGDAVAIELLHQSAQHQANFAGAVRRQLFAEGDAVRVATIGGVWRSARLRERFRLLVEMADGVTCGPPEMGPAAGALLEAYRQAGLTVALSNIPEIEKR
ncbi:MAG: ATPase [Bryobacterales bacterium]|nr:ATPase [Bryobacterales bacterium]